MRPGPLHALPLLAQEPRPWERPGGTGFGVDLVQLGAQEPAVVVFGATASEAQDRAREVLAGLRRPHR